MLSEEPDLMAELDAAEDIVMGGATVEHRPGPKRMIGRRLTQDCRGCGQRWPCDGSWQARAEAAEAKLALIAAHCRARLKQRPQLGPPAARADVILGIIGREVREEEGT